MARANLILPLRGHDFSVDTGDLDAGVQTSTVVGLNDVTAVNLASANTTVVRALGTGEAAAGPAVRPAISTQKGVLLLQTEPELLLGICLHQPRSFVAMVVLVRSAIGIPGFAENEDVVTAAERVGKDGNRAQIDIGVVTRSLASRRAVEVPLW